MMIHDTTRLKYDPSLKNQNIILNAPKKADPVFIKEKLEKMADENPDDEQIKEYLSRAVSVEISDEGKKLASATAENDATDYYYKESGKTSKREAWEANALDRKRTNRYDHVGNHSIDYMLYMTEPETYEKLRELSQKAYEAGHKTINGLTVEDLNNKERLGYLTERSKLMAEWFDRTCMRNGTFVNPISDSSKAIDKLERKYSDIHNLSINIYGKEDQDEIDGKRNIYTGASLWRYSSKFNLLLSKDMLDTLTNGTKKEQEQLNKRIDDVVNTMKEIEKEYEGDKVYLRFGAKFHTDGSVTYHANYKDCEDPYGIQANSADELLEKLMADK